MVSPQLPKEHECPNPHEGKVKSEGDSDAEDIADPLNHLMQIAKGGESVNKRVPGSGVKDMK